VSVPSDGVTRRRSRRLIRLWERSVGEDVGRLFPIAYHRVVLGALLVIALVAQTVLSINAVRPDDLIAQQLLADESEANSVVAVQRESFNVAIRLSDWGHGAANVRDVQVARALLGQRLSVITRSGTSTASNVGAPYLSALAALDEVILGLGDVAPEDVGQVLAAADPALQVFLTETRALTEIFQRLGRVQIETLVTQNRSQQLVESGLQLAVVLLVGLLSLSIVVALGRGYRRVVARLDEQRVEVAASRRELDLIRDIDALLAPLLRGVDHGVPTGVVLDGLRGVLDGLDAGVAWGVPVDEAGTVSARVLAAGGPSSPTAEGAALLAVRAQGVVDALARRARSSSNLEQERRRDPLTGLANRLGFAEHVQSMLASAPDRAVSVCFLDVDRFGEVNGALGFAGADRVLVELAGRLRSALADREDALVARMAADEFAVAVPVASHLQADLVIDALRAAGTYLSSAGGVEAAISVCVGEAVAAGGEVDGLELMRRAAVAMLLAKDVDERRAHVRFDPLEHDGLSSSLVDELAVRNALRAGEFVMHYQPIVDLATGRPMGLEALVRWDRPGSGLVAPGDFLPLIERSGFAVEFGFEVLTEVLATWQRSLRDVLVGAAGPAAYVSVNVDAQQLADPGFEAFVRSALERAQMDPRQLVLELTEHTAVDVQHADMLSRLREVGVRIAVDDFGSGYSSLGQSTQLPVDMLKLDRSFVSGVIDSDHDFGLFADLARLADTLGMHLTAEGIETVQVANILVAAGIELGQGFLYSRALPEQELVDWVRAQGAEQVSSNEEDVVSGLKGPVAMRR
jgi:diguanylate cyclase (GGDEF)-like protein